MSILPFKVTQRDWDDDEKKTFIALFKFRMSRARSCQYNLGLSEDKSPFFTLFVETTGEVIMHICRGPNGRGYLVMRPTRKTTYVASIEELHRGYAKLDGDYVVKFYAEVNE